MKIHATVVGVECADRPEGEVGLVLRGATQEDRDALAAKPSGVVISISPSEPDQDLNGPDRASVLAAKAMGLDVGDDVSIAGCTYRITGITDSRGVTGRMTAEHGHFVRESAPTYCLDMRQGGWTKLGN